MSLWRHGVSFRVGGRISNTSLVTVTITVREIASSLLQTTQTIAPTTNIMLPSTPREVPWQVCAMHLSNFTEAPHGEQVTAILLNQLFPRPSPTRNAAPRIRSMTWTWVLLLFCLSNGQETTLILICSDNPNSLSSLSSLPALQQ